MLGPTRRQKRYVEEDKMDLAGRAVLSRLLLVKLRRDGTWIAGPP